jgi:carboxyl-terminal processing protease
MKFQMRLFSVLVVVSLFAAGCRGGGPPAVSVTPIPTVDAVEQQLRVFDSLWAAVRDQYVRDDYHGVDWHGRGDEYRARVMSGQSDEQFVQTLREMLSVLPDDQATYETRAQRLAGETVDRRVYYGIGAFIAFRAEPEPHVVILSIVNDSPAERAGLLPHDTIHAVDGLPYRLADAASPAERIRGPEDSQVILSVASPGQPRRDVTIQRELIRAVDVVRGGYMESLGVAYYRMPVAAERNLPDTIAHNLASISERVTPRGIILDLRVARSGSGTWPLTDMLTLFGNGSLGEFYNRAGADRLHVAGTNIGGSQTLPLIILIGPDTEGSPEIFAGALQSAGRAVLIGMPTPGAVEGYSRVHLPDGSRVVLATSSFRAGADLDLAEAGLRPDLLIEADWNAINIGSDPIMDAAVDMLLRQEG